MAEIIKARVWQKVDTEANWNANPLILGPGEQAFVVNSAGLPINFKVGDGTKRFSELPWSIQYAGGQYIQLVGNALPAPTVDAGYSLVGPGTYTFSGQANIVAPEGRLSQLLWDGTSWSLVDMGELPQVQGTDTLNPVGENIPKEKAVADYISEKTVELVLGKNLFNPADIQVDKYVNNSGSIVNGAGWACSGYIPVSEGAYFLSSDKGRHGLALFDSNKQTLRYLIESTGLIDVVAGEAFIVFNLKSPAAPNWTWAQLERGTTPTPFEPYTRLVPQASVEGLSEIAVQVGQHSERLDDLKELQVERTPSTNLIDPSKALSNTLLSGVNGGTTTGGAASAYHTTDFFPVEAGKTYAVKRSDGESATARTHAFYDETKLFISGGSDAAASFVAPAGAKFARASLLNGVAINDYGIFEGLSTPYEPFGDTVTLLIEGTQSEDKPDDAIATMSDLRRVGGALSYNYSSGGVLELSNENDRLTIIAGADRGFNGNNMLNFSSFDMAGLSKGNGDDVAPVHMESTTLGANHGRPHSVATITAHGLDDTAIGQAWEHSNGKTYYPVRIIDANSVGFLSENEGTLENPVFTAMPEGTITRGGITLTVSAIASAQLYPSIKNLSLDIYTFDGREISGTASGSTSGFKIIESYEIMSSVSTLNKLIARAGENTPPVYDGDGIARIENVYIFNSDLSVVVLNTFEPLLPVAFRDIMVTQAIPLNSSAQFYVPNSVPLNASVDLRKPASVAWSSSIPSAFVVISEQPDPTNPPNRVVQYFNNTGFMVGYLTDVGTGANLPAHTARTFEIRGSSGKIYPHPLESEVIGNTAPVGEAYSTGMYRAYCDLSKVRTAQRLSYFVVPYNDAVYVFVDYSASTLDRLQLEREDLIGRRVMVLQEVNAEVLTDVYTGSVMIKADYVEGETCFAVFKLIK